MQCIRETLISSTIALALTASGAALAADQEGPKPAASTKSGQHVYSVEANGHVSGRDPAAPRAVISQERVRIMQAELAERGLYQGKIDGINGPGTQAALREFQNRNGLQPTGELNVATANALGMNGERQPVAGTEVSARVEAQPGVKAPAAVTPHTQPGLEDASANVQLSSLSQEQAKEMQQRLQLLGFYRGEIDGVPGAGTRAALQRYFQTQADLASRGVISNSAISMFGTEVQDVP